MSALPGAISSLSSTPALNAAAAKPVQPEHHGFTFDDFLDVINPLQHIPVVSTLYRKITGDEMSPTSEILGGALFGGLVGAVASIADVVFTKATGKNVGDTVLAWLGIGDRNATTQFAKTEKPATPIPAEGSIANAISLSGALPLLTQTPVATAPLPAAGTEIPGLDTLTRSLSKQGVDAATAARAAFAYRTAIGLPFADDVPRAPAH